MDSIVYYQYIQKDMYSSKQEYVDALAYWDGTTFMNGQMINVKLPGNVEASIGRHNVKQTFIRTIDIFKLLYL